MTQFVLMMTRDDVTVPNAVNVYRSIAGSGISCVGFKDIGVTPDEQAELVSEIRTNGQRSFLEVVDLTEEGESRSAQAALDIGVDYLVGGTRIEPTLETLKGSSVRYMPYVGRPVGHPAELDGEIHEIVSAARQAEAIGAHGINLLSFRYRGDALELTRRVVDSVGIPVLAAGSVDSLERVRQLAELGVWGFTIGGAVMSCSLADGGVSDQIRHVLEAIARR